jgi:hypothetical protein
MAPRIDVDDDVYEKLKTVAQPFVDTPNTVLRRLLGLPGNNQGSEMPTQRAATRPVGASRPAQRSRQSRHSASSSGKRGRERAPAGSILPEEEYELPLLRTLVEAGGKGPSKDIIEAVGEKLGGRLTPLDRERLKSGGVRWENRIQFVRLRLLDRGLMLKDTPRGVWAITEDGRQHVERYK